MGSKAEELADSDLGAKAEQTAEEAGSKLQDASENVQVGVAASCLFAGKSVAKYCNMPTSGVGGCS